MELLHKINFGLELVQLSLELLDCLEMLTGGESVSNQGCGSCGDDGNASCFEVHWLKVCIKCDYLLKHVILNTKIIAK
jgi:hypothetical protein